MLVLSQQGSYLLSGAYSSFWFWASVQGPVVSSPSRQLSLSCMFLVVSCPHTSDSISQHVKSCRCVTHSLMFQSRKSSQQSRGPKQHRSTPAPMPNLRAVPVRWVPKGQPTLLLSGLSVPLIAAHLLSEVLSR